MIYINRCEIANKVTSAVNNTEQQGRLA